jgi:hypothetical protein
MDFHVRSNDGKSYIFEMQVKRHNKFDEKALFYACATYSKQLSEKELDTVGWCLNLKPVIAIQVLNYDTCRNIIKGISPAFDDTLLSRVRDHKMGQGQFIKHYLLTDKESEQPIDAVQLIQIELPRGREVFGLGKRKRGEEEAEPWWQRTYQDEKGSPYFLTSIR